MKKIHRFLLPPDLSHQIRDVLKMQVEEVVEVMDGQGLEARAKIVSANGPVEVEIEEVRLSTSEPTTKVVLYAAILKKEHFELVVQKATEVGTSEVVPIISSRTVKVGLKLERLRKIAGEATEQSGRGTVPIIQETLSFKQALIDSARNDRNVILHTAPPTKTPPSLPLGRSPRGEAIARGGDERVGVFVGPEGGWTDEEVAEAIAAGCTLMSLGPRILRGETAAIIATYLAAMNRL